MSEIKDKIKEISEPNKTKWFRKAKVLKAIRDAESTPWCVTEILKEFVRTSNILLREKDYDGHGYEKIVAATRAAEKILKELEP